jgi:hypothetical protein
MAVSAFALTWNDTAASVGDERGTRMEFASGRDSTG